ncbi:hypothetical protein GCM10010297_22810 [Streptomyces malachitofuscus]|nr:hypothetical protein GCM10010297_22810 [Streptomyces malachitofuscus]
MDSNAGMKKSITKNFAAVAKTPAVKHLTGTEFKPTQHKGPQPVGQPTRLRGFSRSLGVVGGVAMAAQAPSYVREYGLREGAWEMTKDIVDPFGFHEALEPPQTSGGACPPESCA